MNITAPEFHPVDIDQTHDLVRSYVNLNSPEFWRSALAFREFEELELQ
jgi:hypothetical protein